MNINFNEISYLQKGNNRQQQAYHTLTNHYILLKLKEFTPILTGTIPININIESSDLDIICYFVNRERFIKSIIRNFENEEKFIIKEWQDSDKDTIVANFFVDDFEIEIYGQNIPVQQQMAYRHMVIEYNLLKQYGEEFRQKIIELKRQGYKTEPAFALALELKGDPYTELLKFEEDNNFGNKQLFKNNSANTMDLSKLTNETVKKAVESLQANDKTAWYALFTENAIFTDDERQMDFKSFFDNAFNKKEKFLEIDTVEDDGKTLYGKFYAGQWGTFRVYFKFHLNEEGKLNRLDIGQASK